MAYKDSFDNQPVLNLPNGKTIQFRKFITMNPLISYEEAINKGESSRDAFVRLLLGCTSKETPTSFEEIGQAADEDLIKIGMCYVEDGSIKGHFDKYQDEPDFFEQFKKAFLAYSNELMEPLKKIHPNLTQLSQSVRTPLENAMKSMQGIINVQQGLMNFHTLNGINPKSLNQWIAPYEQTMKNIAGSPTIQAAKNQPKPLLATHKEADPASIIPIIQDPSVKTNQLIRQMIDENRKQSDENREIQRALVAGIENLIEAQIASSKQSDEQFEHTNNQNKFIIGLTTTGIIVSLILGVSGFLATVFTSAIHDLLVHLFGK